MSAIQQAPASPAANPLRWVPSLYFVQGLQFFVVMLIASMMYKKLGVENDQIARWTSLIGLAWAFKPLWSPFLELIPSKKRIVVSMQFLGAVGLLAVALALQLPSWFGASLAVFFVLAYASATHDIACDGLYMASLSDKEQAAYAGWQGAFFNASKFLTQGGLLILAGLLAERFGLSNAWTTIFVMLGVLLALLASYNAFALPNPLPAQVQKGGASAVWQTLVEVIADLLRKPGIWIFMLFIVLFRLAEGQVQTIGPLFLLEAREKGGLGLTQEQTGGVYGTVGTAAFLVGSILGGYFTSRLSLRRAMPVLLLAMAVPSVTFYYLAAARPADIVHIGAAIALEMFGYGFGFVGMILFIMQVVAPGRFQTAHYALGSGVMQLGFILARSFSGDVQLALGYERFFLWTIACGVPALLLYFFVRFPQAQDAAAEEAAPQAGALPAGH
ncbi:MFS transporter [Roseateles sp. DB2]|uniref:MFS transporter n=1 Tax=Roseateles sp. DB2 TaxID=3453717 RepID=UPI003EEC5160